MTLDFERSLKIEIKAQQNDVGISRMLKLIIRFYLMALQKPNQLVFTKHYSKVILLSRSTNCCCPLRSDFIRATVHEVEQQCGNAMVLVFKSHFPTFETSRKKWGFNKASDRWHLYCSNHHKMSLWENCILIFSGCKSTIRNTKRPIRNATLKYLITVHHLHMENSVSFRMACKKGKCDVVELKLMVIN